MNFDSEEDLLQQKNELKKLIEKKIFNQAELLAKNILKKNTNDYDTLFYLSRVYLRLNKKKKAYIVIKRLLYLCEMSNEWGPLYYLAQLQLQSSQTAGNPAIANKILQLPSLNNRQKCLTYQILRDSYIMLGEARKSVKYAIKAAVLSGFPEQYSSVLLNMHYIDSIHSNEILKQSKKYNNYYLDVKQYKHNIHNNSKIRIGYISPNFNKHAVALFVYNLLANYDRNKFEVYCYAKCHEDEISEQLKQYSDKWVNIVEYNDAVAAEIIYKDNIDILFELAGHTANNVLGIMARKPAPLQISGIGYFNTTGLNAIDYFLTDIYCSPIEKYDNGFSEKLLHMPHSHLSYTPLNIAFPLQNAPCIKNKYITFGSMNFLGKINLQVIKTWQKILDKIPNARLCIKDKTVECSYAIAYIKEQWHKNGIDLSRIDFEPASQDYMQKYYEFDIALDTFPYPGGATTCDALYMGVPVITLVGNRHGSCFGYSFFKNIGNMDECIGKSIADYINKAVKLSNDFIKINNYHHNLRQRMIKSPLMDAKIYMDDIQRIYEDVWLNYMNKR